MLSFQEFKKKLLLPLLLPNAVWSCCQLAYRSLAQRLENEKQLGTYQHYVLEYFEARCRDFPAHRHFEGLLLEPVTDNPNPAAYVLAS